MTDKTQTYPTALLSTFDQTAALMRHLLTSLLRSTFVLALLAGMMLPKMSAALVTLLPNVQTVVICTGDELLTIVLGPDGTPIEIKDTETMDCTLTDTGDPTVKPVPFWVSLKIAELPQNALRINTAWARDKLASLPPQRGPPALA